MLTFGSTAGELATQGKIYGVEAKTGKKVWEFNTIKDDPKSWPAESGKYGGGGAWMPGTYDPETNTVFSGGVHSQAKNPAGAVALLKFLTSPDAARAIRKAGMEPG